MTAKHTGLGRGLGALIKDVSTQPVAESASRQSIQKVPTHLIHKSPWQPRQKISESGLEELTHSVRERGVLQPLLVRRVGDRYELIAGERRLRAAQAAEIKEVPVQIMDVTDREALELALIENVQREDLNIIEEAEAYRALAEKFEMTQEQIAERVGRARATVANTMRLLELPDTIKRLLAEKQLTTGHAKVLLALSVPQEQESFGLRAAAEDLSVRDLEKLVARAKRTPTRKHRIHKADIPEEHVKFLAEQLHERLGTTVRVFPCRTLPNGKKIKGHIEIDFFSSDDLDRILVLLGVAGDL
jgi:ParB family chromosome partitioning protein